MKNALLISGHTRSLNENYPNLHKYLLENNNIDIFLHITTDCDETYSNNKMSLDTIHKLLNPKIMIISKNYKLDENPNINNILNQNYKFYVLNEERKKIEILENITYNTIIKIRPDVYFQQKIDLNIEKNKIYIPKDSKIDKNKLTNPNDNYICDIIAYGDPFVMNEYFNFYNNLKSLINNYGYVNETLLYYYLYNNIYYELIDIDYIVILSLCNTIAISGDSGSGKTTISNIIKQLFNNSFILECDRYHKWERGNDNWKKITHLNPEANYITKMTSDVFDLKIGNNIYQVDYDHKTGKFTDNEKIESRENIIICGLHCLYIPHAIINLKIYIDTDENLRIPWKIQRDIQKRGYTIEKIVEQINERKRDFDMYIYPQKTQADIIINFYTNTTFDINTFNIQTIPSIFLRIGIKNSFELSKIISSLAIQRITNEDNIVYLYFNDNYDYDNIIKTIIINLG